MKRSSSASSASDSSDTSDSDSAADNKKKREEEEEDLWQHLTYWTLEEEEEDSEQVMDQDNNGRVFAKIYAVDAENGATTEQLIELFDPFFDDGGVTDSELMMVCLVSGSL